MRILIAEDQKELLHALQVFFQRNHFTVDAVDNGKDALAYLRLSDYDVAVMDVMMPQMDGLTVLKRIRKEKISTPVLLLTAKSEIEDRVEGLDTGANDYLTKPFDVRELLARVRVLVRIPCQQCSKMELGNVVVDTVCYMLSGPEGDQTLTNKEFQVLLLLMRTPGAPVSVEKLLTQIWECESVGLDNALWTVIYNLRKKLNAVGADIEIRNKRNQGYILEVHL